MNHRHLTGFETAVDLFVTLDRVSQEEHRLYGGVKHQQVTIFTSRLRKFVRSQFRLTDVWAHWKSGGETVWTAGVRRLWFPDDIDWTVDLGTVVMQCAMLTMMNKARPMPAARRWLVGRVQRKRPDPSLYRTVNAWAAERSARDRVNSQRRLGRRPAKRRLLSSSSETGSGDDSDVALRQIPASVSHGDSDHGDPVSPLSSPF